MAWINPQGVLKPERKALASRRAQSAILAKLGTGPVPSWLRAQSAPSAPKAYIEPPQSRLPDVQPDGHSKYIVGSGVSGHGMKQSRKPEMQERVREIRLRLMRRMEETEDPILPEFKKVIRAN